MQNQTNKDDFVLEVWSFVRHQTGCSALKLFQTFPRQRGRQACITEQEHSCISKWSRLCATTRTAPSTTTPTSMEGSLRFVTQRKNTCFGVVLLPVSMLYNHSHQKTQRRGLGRIFKMDKISSSKHQNQDCSKRKSGGILWRYNFTWRG